MRRREFLTAGGVVAAIGITGCDPSTKKPPSDAPVDESKLRELKVLIVDDAPFAEIVARDWKSTSQRPFSAQSVSADELRGMKEILADVVIYPPAMLGELAELGRIAPLDERTLEKPELAREEIIDLARVRLGNWGKRVFGIPLSATHLLMACRGDWIDSPPKDWRGFDALCKTLSAERPAALDPLAKETRSLVLLARAASRARGKNQHSTLFDVASMKALIDKPPFVQALEELATRAKGRAEEALSTTTQNVWEQLVSGKAAIGLTWPTASSASSSAGAGDALRFSALPGGKEYYSLADNAMQEGTEVRRFPVLGGAGRLVSVIRGKTGLRDGANLLVLLAGKARGESLGLVTKDAFPCRQSQLAKAGKLLGEMRTEEPAKQFAETVVDSLSAEDYLIAVNLPGAARYTAALDMAIEQTVLERKSAAESLSQAAQEWDAISKEIGIEPQKQAYLRSLGLEEFN